MIQLPKLNYVGWDAIDAKVDEWRELFSDFENYLFIDFETFFSDTYSLTKKDMTYLKFIKHEFFKIQSASIRWGSRDTIYLTDEDEIREYIACALEENPNLIIAAQQVFFDGGIIKFHFGLNFKHAVDLPSLSRAVWPNAIFHNLDAISERLWPEDESKRKADDIGFTKGIWNWTEEIHQRAEVYNNQDTNLLADAIIEFRQLGFPVDVMIQQSVVLMMYLKPRFVADRTLLEEHLKESIETQESAIEKGVAMIKASKLPKSFYCDTNSRNVAKFPTKKAYAEAYRAKYGMPPLADAKEIRKLLSSNDKFAAVLKLGFDIEPPLKESPSKPGEYIFAFGVNDVEFQELMQAHRELHDLWEARMYSKSNQERTRTETFLEYADLADGFIPVPLRPSAAHTHRLGGTEAINMQNLGRNSKLRPALTGGGTHAVNATDSSNIEARVVAPFCEHTDLMHLFETGGDPYNQTATVIFGYEVNRKSKEVDHSMQGAVGKATFLGCNYQMGEERFRAYLNAGPLGMDPIYLEDIEEFKHLENPYKYVIDKYRNSNMPIVKMWYRLQGLLREMQWDTTDVEVNEFVRIVGDRIWLPSGLSLHYPEIGVQKDGIKYNSRGEWNFIFGGKCLENQIQALATVIILRQMVWIEAYLTLKFSFDEAGCALQVHDEVVSVFPLMGERMEEVEIKGRKTMQWPKGGKVEAVTDDLCAIMHRRPDGFFRVPVAAEGGTSYEYSK